MRVCALLILSSAYVSLCICWTEQVNAGWHMRFTDLLEELSLTAKPSQTGIHGNHKNYISSLPSKQEIPRCWNAQIHCHYPAAPYLTGLCFFCLLFSLFAVAYTCNLEIPLVIFPWQKFHIIFTCRVSSYFYAHMRLMYYILLSIAINGFLFTTWFRDSKYQAL